MMISVDTYVAIKISRASVEDYVLVKKKLPGMRAITICLRVKTADKRDDSTILSYSMPDSDNELVLSRPKSLRVVLARHTTWITSVDIADNLWHHVCLSYSHYNGKVRIFVDGTLKKDKTVSSIPVRGNGKLIIGQEQDSFGGGFDKNQNFIGELTGLYIWDWVLGSYTIKKMKEKCSKAERGAKITWSDVISGSIHGEVTLISKSCRDTEKIDACSKQPCKNGGVCKADGAHSYSCQCKVGYKEKNCEKLDTDVAIKIKRASVKDYVEVQRKLPELSALTMCLWVKTKDDRDASTIVSYSVPGNGNEMILSVPKRLVFWIDGKNWDTLISVADDEWHQVCVTFDIQKNINRASLYKDGKCERNSHWSLKTAGKVQKEGKLIIGQEQDSFGGGFDANQNFIGELTGLYIWNRVLKKEEINTLSTKCSMEVSGAVIEWSDVISGSKHGEVALVRNSCKNSVTSYDIEISRASAEDYIRLKSPSREMRAMTLCLWAKTADKRNAASLISYAVKSKSGRVSDNEILLNKPKSLNFWIGGRAWDTKADIADNVWHHICVSWESSSGKTEIYLEGSLKGSSVLKKGHVIPPEGALIIGQEQDKVGGGFSSSQNYIGQLSVLNIFDEMPSKTVIAYMTSLPRCNLAVGNVLSWSDVIYGETHGQVQFVRRSNCLITP